LSSTLPCGASDGRFCLRFCIYHRPPLGFSSCFGSRSFLRIPHRSARRSTKMHASNLLKAVLKPRSLSSTTSGRKQSLVTPQNEVTTKGKRISSLDHSLPSATSVIARKSSHSSSPPVKVTCLCSPTNHPGSFRCRHHRTGNPLGSASASSSKASGASSRAPTADSRQAAHMIRANGMHNLPSLPGPPPSSLARSPLGRTSRLNPMVASGEAERDIVIPFVNE
jgi:hypothetical protein